MIPTRCPFGPGLVAMISGDLCRYIEFELAKDHMLVPEGSMWGRSQGGGYAFNRNAVIKEHLKPHHEWVWFLDDDMVFDREMLLCLLARRVDMIMPLVITKKPPFKPYIYKYVNGEFLSPDWNDVPGTGIGKWDATACGGLLVKRHIFDALEYPWFKEGAGNPMNIGEDLYFSLNAVKAGFECYVDYENQMGHLAPAARYAYFNKDTQEWELHVDVGRNVRITAPIFAGAELELKSL